MLYNTPCHGVLYTVGAGVCYTSITRFQMVTVCCTAAAIVSPVRLALTQARSMPVTVTHDSDECRAGGLGSGASGTLGQCYIHPQAVISQLGYIAPSKCYIAVVYNVL